MTLRESIARLADRLRRDRLSAELDEELRHHAALAARERSSSLEAHNSTIRDPRSTLHAGRIRESTRDVWSLGTVDELLLDLRFAVRVLRRNLGFTTAVVLTLALGVGANTAIFSVVDAVLLRPMPYADPDRLVSVAMAPTGSPKERDPASYPDLVDWQQQATRSFSGLAAYAFNRYELTGPEGVDQIRAVVGTATLYSVLNSRPLIGRMPRADEERRRVVAISERLWRRRYGARADAVGRSVLLDGTPFTIVGVMPAGFHFPTPDIDLWTSFAPILETPVERPGAPNIWLTSRSLHAFRVVARLAPGVTIDRAESELNAIERRLAVAYPDDDGGRTIHLRSVRTDAIGGVERALWTMLGAAAVVLLLACANVAHLMLVRTSTRTREIAVRRALGAHRARVFRQLFTESVLLALLGGAAGIAVAYAATALFVRLSPGDIPRIENVGISGASLVFALIVSTATGLIFGAAPALVAWNAGVEQTLRDARASAGGTRRGRRLRSLLTTAEVAGAIVLLVGAGLLVRSFANLLSSNIGVEPAGVLAFHITLPGERYAAGADKSQVVDRVLAAIRAVPGVTFAGSSTSMPPSRMQESDSYMIEGQPAPRPGESPSAVFIPATTGFAEALDLRVARGRWFTPGDGNDGARVAVVSRVLAERAFSRVDPIGQRILISGDAWRIVGVVDDARYQGVGSPVEPTVYVPFAARPFGGIWVAVKTPGSPSALVKPLSDAVHSVDPAMSLREPRPLADMVRDSVVRPRFQTLLITTFGAVALCLAIVGMYGVVAYDVAQRTAEIGLRLALGSTRGGVIALVVRGGMGPVVAGVGIGLLTALALSRVLTTMVYGVATTDGTTYAAVSGVLLVAALAAVYVPARRASLTDPGLAMR